MELVEGTVALMWAALSTRVGAETTRPFASVIVSGLATATVLTLILLPALYKLFHEEPHPELER